jgi:hypothetical protein
MRSDVLPEPFLLDGLRNDEAPRLKRWGDIAQIMMI